jgi:hypothetical protein
MAGFVYPSNEDILGIGLSSLESADSWSHQAYPFLQSTTEEDLLALDLSALPAHPSPTSGVNGTFMRDQDVIQFPDRRSNIDEQQNPEDVASATWGAWDVGGTVPFELDLAGALSRSSPEW